MIAHRLSTIRNADFIAMADEGKIVETGTHEELLANESHYFRLVEAQRSKSSATLPTKPRYRANMRIDSIVPLTMSSTLLYTTIWSVLYCHRIRECSLRVSDARRCSCFQGPGSESETRRKLGNRWTFWLRVRCFTLSRLYSNVLPYAERLWSLLRSLLFCSSFTASRR